MTKLSDRLFGREVKGSLERVLREPESKAARPVTNVNVPDLDGFVYVPSIGLHVAKERTHLGEDWNQAHESLQKEGLYMLNMYQFVEFLKYLKENPNPGNNAIYKDITAVRDPYRAELIDAKFSKEGKQLKIAYHKLDSKRNYVLAEEPLQDCLMNDKNPGIDLEYWINDHNAQGLPTKNNPNGSLCYWHPREDSVAWFYAGSVGASLNCDGYSTNSNVGLGVRGAR